MKRNTFLIWRGGAPGDFELKVEYRVSDRGNSGINYRSIELTDAKDRVIAPALGHAAMYAPRCVQVDHDLAGDAAQRTLRPDHGREALVRGQGVPLRRAEVQADAPEERLVVGHVAGEQLVIRPYRPQRLGAGGLGAPPLVRDDAN